eukprot:c26648_g1_i1 orf=550-1419(+)
MEINSFACSEEERGGLEGMFRNIRHSSNFLCNHDFSKDMGKCRVDAYALIILNNCLPWFTPVLWKEAKLRICADGGANRIYDDLPNLLSHEDLAKVREVYKPDVIKGDMDSIRPDVKEFYAGLGTNILDESHDQDTTDLHKCVAFIKDSTAYLHDRNLKILVVGALGGRLDHELANINVLYTFSSMQIILLNDENLAFLLEKNCHHEIIINPVTEGPHCGLIPVGGPSKSTTTTGLKWNLDNSIMQFGGLISTSNVCNSETVTVYSDADLLWTISIQKLNNLVSNIQET